MSQMFLEPVIVLKVPPLAPFVASDKFRPGETIDVLRVVWIGEHFREHILHAREGPAPASTLLERVLGIEARDKPLKSRHVNRRGIVEELGGRNNLPITLGQYWWRLTRADQMRWYVGYVLVDGVLYGVHAGWTQGGLHVESGPFGRAYTWAKESVFLLPP